MSAADSKASLGGRGDEEVIQPPELPSSGVPAQSGGADNDSKDEANSEGAVGSDDASHDSSDLRAAFLSSAFSSSLSSPSFVLSRRELLAYYLYYVGNSGLGPYNYAPTQFQNLLTQQASALAPLDASGNPLCGGTDQPVCRLFWAGADRTPASIVLLANGISFAIQAALFLVIGSLADFGTFRPWILILFTLLSIGVSFAWLGTTDPTHWNPQGTSLYILGLVGYQVCLTYWTAAFPLLARCSPEVREAEQQLKRKEIDPPQFEITERMQRNRIANMAFTISSLGELVILAIIQGMLYALHANDTTASNTKAMSAAVAFTAGAWALCAMPWFVLEKHRPGQNLPPNTNYLTAGIKQAWVAATTIWQLKQSLLWLCIYFIISDALGTTVTVVSIVQNQLISFSSTTFNLLLIVGIAAQGIGIYGFWLVQKRYQISTLRMFMATVVALAMIDIWGLIGIGTNAFGFHNVWEAYAYQAFYGLFSCPYYAYGQTLISEFSPAGYEYQFFSLFSIVGKTSGFIGPFISSAIATDSGNNSMPFAFLLGLTCLGAVPLYWLDPRKARLQHKVFLDKGKEIKGETQSQDSGETCVADTAEDSKKDVAAQA